MTNGKLPNFVKELGNFRIEIKQLSISLQYHRIVNIQKHKSFWILPLNA